MILTHLNHALSAHALLSLGHCDHDGGTLVLVGPDEPAFWEHFSSSPEFSDKEPNPLDRWSSRIIPQVAAQFDGKAYFPFGGPPYHPFYTWALNTGQFFASPIGFLVHSQRGLFASFRGAILVPEPMISAPLQSPCPTCTAPCKTACPVGAFDDGYDVSACKAHINSPDGADCIALGCRARRACPVFQGNRPAAQAQFHMEAFQ